jgi:hypothetical protein
MAAKPPSIDTYFLKVWQNNQGFLIVILLIIVLVIAIKTGDGIAGRIEKFFTKIFGSNEAPAGRPEPNPVNLPVNWSPDALVSQFWAALDGWGIDGDVKCQVAKRIFELNSDQFIAVNNRFEFLHADTDYPSMRSKMEGEWSQCSSFSTDFFDKIYQRMSNLGIE